MRKVRNMLSIVVGRAPGPDRSRGLLRVGARVYPCRLGETGITVFKREGDRATPAGRMRLKGGYFRADRTMRLRSRLPLREIGDDDGWCDDPRASQYNQPVKLPLAPSHEVMRRNDRLYDICLVLDWNFSPRIRGRGSAIFLHQCAADGKATLGCIAVEPAVARRLLATLPRNAMLRVIP